MCCAGPYDILHLKVLQIKMKGRYAGRHMTIYGHILPGAVSLANWASKAGNLTPKAKYRLKVVDWLRKHDKNISLTARHFGLDRETVRIWRQRFAKNGLVGLNDKSKRPKNPRRPTTSWEIVSEVVKIRKQYSTWSKYKIQAVMKKKGLIVSASTIGRTLKRKGLIDKRISKKRRKAAVNPRRRFPRGLKVSSPGDMVQIDTKHENILGGRKIYQFTAIDVLTKKRVLKYYSSASARNGANFLNYCLDRFAFKIKVIQTDNGSEFLKEFDGLCKEKRIIHYFTYPHHPKQNSYVENSHGSDEREFYSQGNTDYDIDLMQERLTEWERIWNEVRPHQALNYLTPNEYFLKWQLGRLPTKDVITLQT